jgi:alpha-glucosidase
MLTVTLRGTPFVYEGEELGLPDAVIPPEGVVDVDGRDPERAPIPWERPSQAGRGAGFTTGEPWLPIVGEAERLAVAAQRGNPGSTLEFVRRLLALRSQFQALQSGAQQSVDAEAGIYAYRRGSLLVALNFTSEPRRVSVSDDAQLLLSTDSARPEGPVPSGQFELGPDEGVVVAA